LAEAILRPDLHYRQPSRGAAVKDGLLLGPPGGLILDARELDSRLMCVGIDRQRVMPALVVDRWEVSNRRVTTAALNRQRSRSSNSSVAKKLSHTALP